MIRLKPEKPVFVLPVTYQTQKAETGIESLWALYSDGRQSERTAGLYPNRPSYISLRASLFITENKVWGGVGVKFSEN